MRTARAGRQESYRDFQESRRRFQTSIIRWLRIGICIPLIPILCIVFPFAGPHSLFIMIATPVLLCSQLLLSTLFIKKELENYCPILLNVEISGFVFIGIEFFTSYFDGRMFFGMLVGVEISLLFSLLLVSKLPFKYVFFSYVFFSTHIIYRSSTESDCWVAIFIFLSTELFLLFIYWKLEALDFQIYSGLQKKQKCLLKFKQLVKMIPNQIIILSEDSYKENRALYMNDEAKKLAYNLDLKSFFGFIRMDEMTSEVFKNKTPENLHLLIQNMFNEKEQPTHLVHHQSTINKRQIKSAWQKTQKNPFGLSEASFRSTKGDEDDFKSFTTFDKIRKYEIFIGNIEWEICEHTGMNEEQDALIIMLQDVLKQERIQALKKINANKDQLLATVSHDLRTPLNGIIGMLNIADEKSEDKKTKKYINIAKNSAKTLLFLINDILDAFQTQRGLLKLNYENVNINNLIENIVELMRIQIKKKGLQLHYNNNCEPQTFVRADRNRLQQIIFNLLSNAFKFTEVGAIKIDVYPTDCTKTEIKTSKQAICSTLDNFGLENENTMAAEAEEITIKVTDSGRGIKPEVVPELFKNFGKFEVNGNETGVGLGLAISQRLAKKMTSKGIQVASMLGKGSEFWIDIPKASEAFSGESPEEVGDRRRVPSFPDKKSLQTNKTTIVLSPMANTGKLISILIVDDDQVNQTVIGKYLLPHKLLVSAVEKVFNGEEAVQRVKRKAQENKFFQLILMDCNMPVMDGFQATKIIREMVNKREIPELYIIAVTANASMEDRAACLSCGMNDVLLKPIQKEDFEEKMNLFLNFYKKID